MNNARPRPLMRQLRQAILKRDKKMILDLYEKLQKIDWRRVSFKTSEEYDELIDKGNDILYS
jgi:hypothetical protein